VTVVAVKPVVRTLTQFVVVRYTYNALTGRTTVTKSRSRRIQVQLTGSVIKAKNASGHWVRIPYVWNRAKRGLVYDHKMQLALVAATARIAAPVTPQPAPVPAKPTATTPSLPPSAAKPSPDYVTSDPIRHLLRRATYAPTTESIHDVQRLGIAGWVDQQLAPSTIDDSVCEAMLTRLPDQSEPIWQVGQLLNSGARDGWQQIKGVLVAHVIRSAWSKRQLLAVMEDFWGNHFNVTVPGSDVEDSRAHYAYMLRAGAFGRFADLLRSVTTHPSMLTYLNNRDSSAAHPNENHGRELLELHTVGVEAGYGEVGVVNSARILTGLSVSGDSGEYLYKPWRHYTGAVTVLEFARANATQPGGEAVALAYIDYLAHHPATANRLAWKLARHFVSDDPPAALVSRLAATYLANDTNIAPVLRQLLNSPEFAASIGLKTRRPFEQLMATVRVLNLQPDAGTETGGIEALAWHSKDAGHALLGWPFPTGHADVAGEWLSTATTLARWNSTMDITANWWPSSLTRQPLVTEIFAGVTPANYGAAVDTLAMRLFGRALLPEHRTTILAFLGATADRPVTADSSIMRWNLDDTVALMLDSPYHLTR